VTASLAASLWYANSGATAVPAAMKLTSVAAPIGAAEPCPKLAEMTRGAELSGADPTAAHVAEASDAVRAQCCGGCSTGERHPHNGDRGEVPSKFT
jgi:hypothetical protein